MVISKAAMARPSTRTQGVSVPSTLAFAVTSLYFSPSLFRTVGVTLIQMLSV